jgi:hypothetical protein
VNESRIDILATAGGLLLCLSRADQLTMNSSRKADMARQAAMDKPIDLSSQDCSLLAMQQFTCTYVPNIRIDCKPFWRIFSM